MEGQPVKTKMAAQPAPLPSPLGSPFPTVHLRGRQAGGDPIQWPVQQHGAQSSTQVSRHHPLLLQAAVVLQGQDDRVGGHLEAQGQIRRGLDAPSILLHPDPWGAATLKA